MNDPQTLAILERIDRIQSLCEELAREKEEMRNALRANLVFHTPIALRRRGGQWDEYEVDAINRTNKCISQ